MKITLLQTAPAWHAVAENMASAEHLMDAAPASDLYVLPEMWATGFDTNPAAELKVAAHEALAWMKRQARLRRAAVAGTLAFFVEDERKENGAAGEWRNRFFFVRPEEEDVFYDKRNLFAPGGEQAHYSAGQEPCIVAWRGVRFMLQTCFDLRFPETGRNSLALAYDVLLYAANWPCSRRTAWHTLLPARAIENQAYCVGVNRTGSDPTCLYDGGSSAYDAYGLPLVLLYDAPSSATFEPDVAALHAFRKKFKVLR